MTQMTMESQGSRDVIGLVVVIFLVALAAAIRLVPIGVDGFWLDEVYSASFANLGFLDLFVAVFRFDLHPPLYYLQLSIWGWASQHDYWLLLNSVAWSLGTIIVASYGVFLATGREIRPAVVSLLMLATLGSEVYYASELRMYAMVTFLTVLSWLLAREFIAREGFRSAAWLTGSLSALALTHSTAFIPISAIFIYLMISPWGATRKNYFKAVFMIATTLFLVLVPCLLNASFRSVSHTVEPDLETVIQTIGGWFIGYGLIDIATPARSVAGIFVVLLIVLLLVLRCRDVRVMLVSFVVWPIIALFFLSYAVRPVWISRAIAFCAPFIVIALAMALHRLSVLQANQQKFGLALYLAAVICSVLMGVTSIAQAATPRKMQYRDAANFIKARNINRTPVYAPTNTTFWGMARYIQGPNWGGILEIQDPEMPDRSETWARIYKRLGPVWLDRLHLRPRDRKISTDQGDVWTGLSPLPEAVRAHGLWVVGDNSLRAIDACGTSVNGVWKFRGVVVYLCRGAAS